MSVKQLKTNQKNKKGGFLSMLLGTLAASVTGNVLAGKEVIPAGEGVIQLGEGTNGAGQNL